MRILILIINFLGIKALNLKNFNGFSLIVINMRIIKGNDVKIMNVDSCLFDNYI